MTNISFRRSTVVAAVTVLAATATGTAETRSTPRPVSPGSATGARLSESACPTFSWSGTPDAKAYEIVILRIGKDGIGEQVVRAQVAGGARTWTPSAAECHPSESTYAWSLRAITGAGVSAWSESLLFAIAARPTREEVHRAREILMQHHPDGTVGRSVAGVSASADDPESAHVPIHDSTVTPLASNDETEPAYLGRAEPSAISTPTAFALTIDGDLGLEGAVFSNGTPFIHRDGGIVGENTALGLQALTSGVNPQRDTAFGYQALHQNTTGDFNSAAGHRALYSNTAGNHNTAAGSGALESNLTGNWNTALGADALEHNTSGSYNTAAGFDALGGTGGSGNTAIGHQALGGNSGNYNTAAGYQALLQNDGDHNAAAGHLALLINSTGSDNTAIGVEAGRQWTTGDRNIAIGRGAEGAPAESATIRIGGGDFQTSTFIEGIHGTVVAGGVQIVVNAVEKFLGTVVSSRRFKRDVYDLAAAGSGLLELRPVSFRYRKEILPWFDPLSLTPVEYGLVAEEVDEVLPDLVIRDSAGRAEGVRYRLLAPLLLAEVQRQQREILRQEEDFDRQDREFARLCQEDSMECGPGGIQAQ